jgi:hypothetical protein
MNKKLTEQILSLVRTMSETEINDFKNETRSNTNYRELLEIFVKYKKSKAKGVENKIDTEGANLQASYNDTKENLLKKLLGFIAKIETEKDTTLNKARKLIDTSRALISRNQYDLACEKVYDNFDILNEIQINKKNYYLFLEYLDVVTEIQKGRNYDKDSRLLPNKFDNSEIIDWLNSIVQVIVSSNIRLPKNDIYSDFESNLFYNLYIDYIYKSKEYRYLDDLIEKRKTQRYKNILIKEGLNSTSGFVNNVFNVLDDLKLLEIAIKLKDKNAIERHLRQIESHAQMSSKGSFNYQIYIFIAQQIFDFRLNAGFDLEELSLLSNTENLYPKTSDFNLFTDAEIVKTALRIEINRGILLLFTARFEKAHKLFGAIKSDPVATPEMKFYLTLFEIIAYYTNFQEYKTRYYEKLVDSAKHLRIKGNKYSTLFLKFLETNIDRRKFTENAKEFQSKHEPLNTFDKVLHYWLTTMQPTT